MGGNAAGMPQMAGMMPGYYNMYHWPGMAGMMLQMAGMSARMTQIAGMSAGMIQLSGMMPQMMPQMVGMSAATTGTLPQIMPQMAGMSRMMGMMQGQPAAAGGSRAGVPDSPGDNVYRPTIDFLTGGSQTCTSLESQFTSAETFSLEELGLSPVRVPSTQSLPAGGRRGGSKKKGRGRGKGKGVAGESSQAGDDGEERPRTIWNEEECVALSKAWINVCDDPIASNNQRIDNMWNRIANAYSVFKPADGRIHTFEECRKQWDQIRTVVSRFAGLYENNSCMRASAQTMEDVKTISMLQFPERGKHAAFKYWDAYVVLMESSKFRAGVAAGWPKRQRINNSGEYSSSVGSANLPGVAEEIPTPPLFIRRRCPVGQKTAMRMSKRGACGSQEVQSAAPSVQLSPELYGMACI